MVAMESRIGRGLEHLVSDAEDEVRADPRLHAERVPVTVQGARTGLAAGLAVPHGGHILNARMNRYLAFAAMNKANFCCAWSRALCSRSCVAAEQKFLPTAGWDQASLEAYEEFKSPPSSSFPPMHRGICLSGRHGGIRFSGAPQLQHGPMRPHITGLHVALADGDLLELPARRGFCPGPPPVACDGGGPATSSSIFPAIPCPRQKMLPGYFVADDMDAIDLFIGACGTIGRHHRTRVPCRWHPRSLGRELLLRQRRQGRVLPVLYVVLSHAAAIEYFDTAAPWIFYVASASSRRRLPRCRRSTRRPESMCLRGAQADDEAQATEELYHLGWVLEFAGGSDDATWVARTEVDRECQRFFRHAVPESVNMLIDERRRTDPTDTKLGSDMSVPNARLADVIALYRRTLAESGLESAAWGHIGNNHLHVNILPRDAQDYRRGGELFARVGCGGNGYGRCRFCRARRRQDRAGFLETMLVTKAMVESARLKLQLDPAGQLGRGNLFRRSSRMSSSRKGA